MKAVVFAYNNIGCIGIEQLVKAGVTIQAVFTHADDPNENLWFRSVAETAAALGIFGSIDANQGDYLLGWDTDQFPTDYYETTFCMLEVLRAGGFTNGGLNFDAKARRGSNTWEDIAYSYIAGMDAFALGLRMALKMIEDGRIDAFIEDRYSSYNSGIGAKIRSGEATLEELAAYAEEMGSPALPGSGRQEYLESVMNDILFSGV